jgi:hypothetical protein
MLEGIAKLSENMQKVNELLKKLAAESERRATETRTASLVNKLENEQSDVEKGSASNFKKLKTLGKDLSAITTDPVLSKPCEAQRNIQNENSLKACSESERSMNRADSKPGSKSELGLESRRRKEQEKQHGIEQKAVLEIKQ